MEIEMVKKAKQQCESEIRAIIKMFEEQSGCTVRGIDISRAYPFGMKSEIVDVKLDVRIED